MINEEPDHYYGSNDRTEGCLFALGIIGIGVVITLIIFLT